MKAAVRTAAAAGIGNIVGTAAVGTAVDRDVVAAVDTAAVHTAVDTAVDSAVHTAVGMEHNDSWAVVEIVAVALLMVVNGMVYTVHKRTAAVLAALVVVVAVAVAYPLDCYLRAI